MHAVPAYGGGGKGATPNVGANQPKKDAGTSDRKFAVMPRIGALGGYNRPVSMPAAYTRPAAAPTNDAQTIGSGYAPAPGAPSTNNPVSATNGVKPSIPPNGSSPHLPSMGLGYGAASKPVVKMPTGGGGVRMPVLGKVGLGYGAVQPKPSPTLPSSAGRGPPPVEDKLPIFRVKPLVKDEETTVSIISSASSKVQLIGRDGMHTKVRAQSSSSSSTTIFGSLNVPLREPTPEPVFVPVQPMPVVKEATPEDDGAQYGDVSEIDICIRNVVCNYSLPLHIDLHRIALTCNNVTFDRGKGVLLKQLRSPQCYIKMYSSGKIYIVGCKSELECTRAARVTARKIQRAMNKLRFDIRMRNYRVCNVLATVKLPFGIKIEEVAAAYPSESQYEPELSVGLIWRNREPKATLRIHTTGSITVTGAQSEEDVHTVITMIYPIVRRFHCPFRHREKGETAAAARKRRQLAQKRPAANPAFSRYQRGGGGPMAKMGRIETGVVGGRMHFSDEEDDYDDDYYDDDSLLSDEGE